MKENNFQKKDGMNYAPTGISKKVVGENEFIFSALYLKHGHIFGMTNGLLEAGATLKYVYDDDPKLVEEYLQKYPMARRAISKEQILRDQDTKLVISAHIPNLRAKLGIEVMSQGKDYFTDKTGCTDLEDLNLLKKAYEKTKRRFFVYFSERLHVEACVCAQKLIEENRIGRVLQVIGLGPHRLNASSRPDWFFQKAQYGGILCDIGSHQIEQYLFFSKAKDAKILSSKIANYHHPDYPELDDFGDCTLVADNGATQYFRVDWFTPEGLSTWGDGRLFILGTEGTIELRKYVDVANTCESDWVYLVTKEKEERISAKGKYGFPFFGEMILDCLQNTDKAMTQEHIFKACELCIIAQNKALKIQ